MIAWVNRVTATDMLRYEVVSFDATQIERLGDETERPSDSARFQAVIRDLDGHGGTERARVALEGPMMSALLWAKENGARALTLIAPGRGPETRAAMMLIILPRNGEPFFAGLCAERDLTTNLKEHFGAGYAAAVEHLATIGPLDLGREVTPAVGPHPNPASQSSPMTRSGEPPSM